MAELTDHLVFNRQHSIMNKIKTKEELRALRNQMFEEMEEKLRAGKSPEDSLFSIIHLKIELYCRTLSSG